MQLRQASAARHNYPKKKIQKKKKQKQKNINELFGKTNATG